MLQVTLANKSFEKPLSELFSASALSPVSLPDDNISGQQS